MGNRKLKIIIVSFFLLFVISGCTTRVVSLSPSLPYYSPNRPQRPNLSEVNDDFQLPISALTNFIKVQSYAKQMEAYASGWEEFYRNLMEENNELVYK